MTTLIPQQEESNAVNFSTVIDIWKTDRQPVADTCRLVTQLFQRFTQDTDCETFQDVTHERLLDWKEGIIDHTTRTTWNTYYRHLKSIGNCAVQAGLIEINPFLQVSAVKEYAHLPKVITDEDLSAGIAAIRRQEAYRLPWFWESVSRFLFYHGIRRKQLVGICWDDINYDQMTINLRAESSKNKTEYLIPLHKTCVDDLIQLQEKTEKIVGGNLTGKQVFNVTLFSVRYAGTEMNRDQVSGFYQRLYEKIGIRIGAHRLRHTMATKLGTTGNICVLQKMLGHKSIMTTQRYVHVDVGDMRTLAISLPELI